MLPDLFAKPPAQGFALSGTHLLVLSSSQLERLISLAPSHFEHFVSPSSEETVLARTNQLFQILLEDNIWLQLLELFEANPKDLLWPDCEEEYISNGVAMSLSLCAVFHVKTLYPLRFFFYELQSQG